MKFKDILLKTMIWFCGIGVIIITFFIFGFIAYRGIQNLSWSFIFNSPSGIPLGSKGGIFPAITGTIYLGILSGLIAGFIATVTAIFTVFYCKKIYIIKAINTSIHFLLGMPSILYGLVGYTILLYYLRLPRSLLTSAVTIAAMIMPFITKRISKVFQDEAKEIMTASLCLGLSKSYVVLKLILPHYFMHIITSITLGVAFGVGAAAPVMLTGAVFHAGTPRNLTQPFMSLSYHLLILVNEGISLEFAYATAFILLLILLVVNIACRVGEHFLKGVK